MRAGATLCAAQPEEVCSLSLTTKSAAWSPTVTRYEPHGPRRQQHATFSAGVSNIAQTRLSYLRQISAVTDLDPNSSILIQIRDGTYRMRNSDNSPAFAILSVLPCPDCGRVMKLSAIVPKSAAEDGDEIIYQCDLCAIDLKRTGKLARTLPAG